MTRCAAPYRAKPPDPDLRVLFKDGSLVVEREGAQFKLSHVEENRYSSFIEGDGYHFFRFNVADGLMTSTTGIHW